MCDGVLRKIKNVLLVIFVLILLAALSLFALDRIIEDMVTTETYEQTEKICKRVGRGRS